MIPIPSSFREEISEILNESAEDFFSALEQPPTLGLRINTLRPGAKTAAERFITDPVPWEPSGVYIDQNTRPGASIEHAAGAFYLQEASAMLSVSVLDPQPGERILDLCAAPGGKTTQIASRMVGKGLLVSNEYEPSRAKVLAANLERMGVVNAIAVNARPDVLASHWSGYFDAVLCDAPCSGEGMFRRDPDSRLAWAPASPEGCALRQAEILDSAAELIRPGGRLVYSTCTFNRKENEGTISSFLLRHPEFAPEPVSVDGVGSSDSGMLRIWPHIQRGDGHFCALLRKSGMARTPEAPDFRNSPDDLKLFKQLDTEAACVSDLHRMRLVRMKDYLYAVPAECPETKGIRIVKPGVCLLRIGKNYIEPEHALAMILSHDKAKHTANLTQDEAVKYLAGETLTRSGEKGWTLVTYKHLPLGWGKSSNDQLKNHLPKALRLSLHL